MVLYKPPEGKKHKIQPMWLGPVVVTGRHDLNAYVVHNAATGMVRTLSVDVLKRFRSDPNVQDAQVALADGDIYYVERILNYQLVNKGKKQQSKNNYNFLVKWKDYEEPEWQHYSASLGATVQFQDYVKEKKIKIFTK